MPTIRVCQLVELTAGGATYRLQNYFIGQDYTYGGKTYKFVGFQLSGSLMSLGGDNPMTSLLMPNDKMALTIVNSHDGNRNSLMKVTQLWLSASNSPLPNPITEFYIGVGAADNDTTLELRFRSAIDSVISSFPRRVISAENVGVLPLDSQISLR